VRTRDFEPVGNGMKVEVPITLSDETDESEPLDYRGLARVVAANDYSLRSQGQSVTRKAPEVRQLDVLKHGTFKPDYVFNSTITRHNVGHEPRSEAGAERTLEGVGSMASLGAVSASGMWG
jgi:hypothetical protein